MYASELFIEEQAQKAAVGLGKRIGGAIGGMVRKVTGPGGKTIEAAKKGVEQMKIGKTVGKKHGGKAMFGNILQKKEAIKKGEAHIARLGAEDIAAKKLRTKLAVGGGLAAAGTAGYALGKKRSNQE